MIPALTYELDALLERFELHLSAKAAPAVMPGLRRRAETEIERRALSAFRALAAAIDERALTRALRDGNIDAALAAVPFDEVLEHRLRGPMVGAIRDAFDAAGARTIGRLKFALTRKDASFAVRVSEAVFDVIDDRALNLLRDHGAALVTEITDSTRLALRELVTAQMEQGVSVTSQVSRIQQMVGLHSRHVAAVENLRMRLDALGTAPATIDRKVAAKARELHRLRAQSIARYESGWATNAGHHEAVLQARDDGLVTETARQVWRTAGDDVVRDEHVEMEGQSVGLDEPFILPDGEPIDFPPTDPGCRCSVDIEP